MAANQGMHCEELVGVINEEINKVQDKIRTLKTQGDQISIGDMFEMQMLMNHLSQLSEMSTQLTSATHQALMSMTRNLNR
jgi:hypothetical protein